MSSTYSGLCCSGIFKQMACAAGGAAVGGVVGGPQGALFGGIAGI